MKSFQDKVFLIRSSIFTKRNILLSIILILILLILLVCFHLIFFVTDYQLINESKNIDMRTLLVYGEENKDFSQIDKLEHVVYNNSTKFYGGTARNVPEFNVDNAMGYVEIYPLLPSNDITIIEGRNIENNYEAICPINFYPHNVYLNQNTNTMKIYPKYYMDSDDIIGKRFVISSENEENSDITVEVVGLYDPEENLKSISSCFISMQDYDQIINPYSMILTSYDENGNKYVENIEYSGNMVVVDDYDNVESVKRSIEEMGFSVNNAFHIDEEILKTIFTIPLLVSLIVIILSLNILYSFINKKMKYRLHKYGILRTLGYNKKFIVSIDTWENLFVFLGSFIIAFLLYLTIYFVLSQTLLIELTYDNFILHFPILFILGLIALFVITIIGICKHKLKKILNLSINELLKD